MPTVLVTGFEVFGPHVRNPTQEAVGLLPETLAGVGVVTGVLPVEYGRCGEVALALVEAHSPDAVNLTGLAAGRSAVTPERVAINLRDTGGAEGFADNSGYAPEGVPIVAGGPDGIFATLPNRRIVEALLAAGIPAEISNSAGTYVCNETLYAALTSLASIPGPRPIAGLVHVPDVDVLPLESIVRALHITVDVVGKAVGTR
ncbi:MAG: pyroglutamyl-peptidase I [Dermatophilaceae bacterium]|nr:pyroglutamyl-peptidase I [Intrasporangiaceae bacterium]